MRDYKNLYEEIYYYDLEDFFERALNTMDASDVNFVKDILCQMINSNFVEDAFVEAKQTNLRRGME